MALPNVPNIEGKEKVDLWVIAVSAHHLGCNWSMKH